MVPLEAHPDWAAIGRVNVTGYRRRSACTGTLVSPDRVVTAAHCLFRDGEPARVEDIRFAAGWFRGTPAAVGRVTSVDFPGLWSPGAPATADTIASDVAILTLSDPITDVEPLPVSKGDGGEMRIIGYRWDRPHALTDHTPCIGTARFAPALGLTCRVVSGTSGAPVLTLEDGAWAVMGVTSARADGITLAAPISRQSISRSQTPGIESASTPMRRD